MTDSNTRDRLLGTARRAALAAGEAIMAVYAQEFDVRQKLDKTPVTEADLSAERVIVGMLADAFPGHPDRLGRDWSTPKGCRPRPHASGLSTRSTAPANLSPRTASLRSASALSKTGGRCSACCTGRRSG